MSIESRLRRLESRAPLPDPGADPVAVDAGLAVKVRLAIAGGPDDGLAEVAAATARTIFDDDGPAAARTYLAGLWAEARQLAGGQSLASFMGITPADLMPKGIL